MCLHLLTSLGPLLPTLSLALCKGPCLWGLPAMILSPCKRDSGNSWGGKREEQHIKQERIRSLAPKGAESRGRDLAQAKRTRN